MSFWWILSIFALVHLCGGNPNTPVCDVTHDSQGWHYKIIGENKPPGVYEWRNATNHTLANSIQNESADVVQWHNSTHLHSKVCLQGISHKRDHHTESKEQIIYCPVNCTENDEAPPFDVNGTKNEAPPSNVNCTKDGTTVGINIVIGIVIVCVGIGFGLGFFVARRLQRNRNARNRNARNRNALEKEKKKEESMELQMKNPDIVKDELIPAFFK